MIRSFFWLLLLLCLAHRPAGAQRVETLGGWFNGSGDVEVATDGSVWIGNFGQAISPTGINGQEVLRMRPDGTVLPVATGFMGASGNAFGPDVAFYQSDIRHQRVVRIRPNGQVDTVIEGGLAAPIGIAVDPMGVLYVNECNTNRITAIDTTVADALPEVLVSSDLFNCPNGLTLGPDGHLYCANFSDGRVNRISLPDLQVESLATLPGGGNGHITSANGRLYVTSFAGNRIYEVALDGTFRPIAGSGAAGNVDGPALEASFFNPNGISASVTGDTLYVNATALVNSVGSLHPNVLRMIILP